MRGARSEHTAVSPNNIAESPISIERRKRLGSVTASLAGECASIAAVIIKREHVVVAGGPLCSPGRESHAVPGIKWW